jgi:hypothetical protein
MTTRFSVRLVLILSVTLLFAAALSAQTTVTVQKQTVQTQTTSPACTPMPSCQTAPSTGATHTGGGGGIAGELYLNAGGVWPTRIDTWDNNKIKAQGVYGLKGGIFFGPSWEIEGSFGYLNHFEPSRAPNPLNFNTTGGFGQPSIQAFMYDLNFAYNFGNRSLFGSRIAPYVVVGGGGLTAEVYNGASPAFVNGGGFVPEPITGTLVPNPTPVKTISSGNTFFTINYGGGFKAMNLWGPVGFAVDVRGRTLPNFYHSTTSWLEPTAGLLFSFGQR